MSSRYFEDFGPGQVFTSDGGIEVSREEIEIFARQFDPQPFHLSPEGGENSLFGRQVASGWHTAALSMRLKTMCGIDAAGGLIGLTVENMTWPRAVLPGDTLRGEIKILEKRPSKSNPARGLVKYHMTTFNQKDEAVLEMDVLIIVPVRET